MKWIIYKHTNKINGKSYIGQTLQDLEARWGNGKNYSRAFKFGQAIEKYGWDNFSHEIIEDNILSQEDANQKECYYIDLFNTYVAGYNSTKGGANGEHLGEEVLQISTKGKIIKKFSSHAEAERETGILAVNIGACLLGQQITAGGYYWANGDTDIQTWTPPKNRKEKAVICIETQKVYDSISKASLETGINITTISSCVCRKSITAGGYHWSYLLEYSDDWKPIEPKKAGGPTKIIICVETGEIYESITECSLITGISPQNLSQNCCKGRRTAKGKHYAYLDEYDEKWEPAKKYTTDRRKQASTRKKGVFCYQEKRFFSSSTEAGEILNIDNRLICRCCCGELIQTHGYNFCWIEDYYEGWKPRKNKQGQKGKNKIKCVESGEVFLTATQVCKMKNINPSSLSGCLNGKNKTAGGYHWKYIEE